MEVQSWKHRSVILPSCVWRGDGYLPRKIPGEPRDCVQPDVQRDGGKEMTRKGILDAAEACVCGQREQDYGSPEDNFRTIAELWRQYIQTRCVGPGVLVDLVSDDVASMMILLKVGRIAGGSLSQDNWVDIAGYAACGGEIATKGAAE